MPNASSFTLGAIFSHEEIEKLLAVIMDSDAGPLLKAELGENILCDRDQSWVRKQYAPSRYPRFHAPHGWHQDGALGFDFASYPNGNYPSDALLPMMTCWIALDDCGVNAPSLEFVTCPVGEVLAPTDLGDARIRMRFRPVDFWKAERKAGEALVFGGEILHRTHVTPQMTKDRTSIEVRFFADRPGRLKADRFVEMPSI